MVAKGRGVKANIVHKCNHRESGDGIEVIQRVAGTVVSCREYQKRFVYGPQRVYRGGQHWHILNCPVNIVAGNNVDVSFV